MILLEINFNDVYSLGIVWPFLTARTAQFIVRGSRRCQNSGNIVNLRPERDSLMNSLCI